MKIVTFDAGVTPAVHAILIHNQNVIDYGKFNASKRVYRPDLEQSAI